MTAPSTEQPPPGQEQAYPGRTAEMDPRPRDEIRDYEGRGLLAGARALITGGDSGIGRAVAVAFAKEGADAAIAYLSEIEDEDAARTAELAEAAGRRCVTIRGDLAIEDNSQRAVEQTVTELGGLDVLVNNVAPQEPVDDLAELSAGQWERTFRFGSQVPMGRAAYPDEIAPSYVFFASGRLSSYYSGEVLAPVGGETLPG
jgi:NAD(P)-dependent dehydrogenase (short-subunit alcohol dehydrogenase family)